MFSNVILTYLRCSPLVINYYFNLQTFISYVYKSFFFRIFVVNSRYSRQIVLKEIGKDQSKLSKSKVAVIGLGALGSHSSELLVRAGIGNLVLIDRDYVELSNLQRQTLYTEEDIDTPKAISAKQHLEDINSEIKIEAHIEDFNHKTAERLLKNANILIDGTDNLEARFLMNDFSVKYKIPWIYGAVVGTEGVSLNIIPDKICLRCIIPDLPASGSLDTCETRGVLNALPPFIAGRQVTQTMKIILKKNYSDKFFKADLWQDKFELLEVRKRGDCICCSKRNFEFLEGKRGTEVSKMCGIDTFQVKLDNKPAKFEKIAGKLKGVKEIIVNAYMLHFNVNEKKISVFKDGRVIVKGVKNEKEAKSLYSRYIN